MPGFAEGSSREILIVHSFGRDFSPYAEVSEAFRQRLAELSPDPVVFVDASLEMARFDGEDRDAPLLDYLGAVYRPDPPDLVVPIGAQAAMFCTRHRDSLFPEAPMLFLGVDRRRLGPLDELPDTAAVGYDLDLKQVLANVLQLLPDTEQVHLVMGATPLERFWEQALLNEWSEFSDRVTVHPLSHRPFTEMVEVVTELPPNSAVFIGILNLDAAGVPHHAERALQTLRQHSNAPIFGVVPRQLGLGIVGGPLLPSPAIGEAGAEIAAGILAGKPTSSFPPVSFPFDPPSYDWRQLKAWNIPLHRLPQEATIRFRPPGLWEEHGTVILIALAVLTFQSLLIARLVVASRRQRASEAALELAAEAADIGLWERLPRSDQFRATPRWREIFRFQPAEPLTFERVLDRVHPEDRDHVTAAIEEAAREAKPFAIEHRLLLPDGSSRWIASHGRAQAMESSHAHGHSTRGASRDITERRQAKITAELQRQELAHLSRVSSLGVLSGALAHELNQPLGIILSNAQAAEHLLRSEHPDLDELREILGDIINEDRRAGDVIRRLRALLQRGQSSIHPLDPHEVVEEVLRLMHSDLIRRETIVDLQLDATTPCVLGDRIQLQQILLNLLVNAADAMAHLPSEQRRITVETGSNAEGFRLSVLDQGVGLPADVASIFRPFHTTKPEGLGMGLAICRTLATAHGGRLEAEPNPVGGAVFHLCLPPAP